MFIVQELIRELSEAFGPSGEENIVRDIIIREIESLVDEIKIDSMGNVIALKKAATSDGKGKDKGGKSGKRIMFAAHMDEIGLIITHIDEKGFLRIAPVGGLNPVHLVGQRFKFSNGLAGTVNHEKIKDIKELEWSKLYMDMGAKDKKSALKTVKVGSMSVYGQQFSLAGDCFMGKAMDNRIGCFVLIEAIKNLTAKSVNDLYFVFTVQEEVGLRGARGAAYGIEPDYAVAVDVTRSGDTPDAPLMEVSLGKGPAVKVMDSSTSWMPGGSAVNITASTGSGEGRSLILLNCFKTISEMVPIV